MLGFMKCVVEGVAAVGVKGLLEFVPGGKYLHDVGAHALKRHREKKAQKKIEDEMKEVIAAKADVALAMAKQVVEEAALPITAREKELLIQFVAAIPEAARQSMKRKDDPTGTSLPFGYTIHESDDVVKLLPQHPPRFVPGEWVPGREDNWRLVRKLGGGGFGEVWLAHHEWNGNVAAVKFCTDTVARNRLTTHEKELIVRVMRHAADQPNIVPLRECHLTGETPWLMYEFVEGGTLADAMLGWHKLAATERVARAVPLLHTLAGAVGHFHALDPAIIHRDLKPANVLMAGIVPRITDFGIGGTAVAYFVASESRGVRSITGRLPTMLSGSYSLLYASPQQRNGEKPDPRDDVHALGVIAYQMLTGDMSAAPGIDMADDLRDAGTPDALIALIGKSIAQKADRRPKDAREWDAVLRELLPKPAPAPTSALTPRSDSRNEQKWYVPVPGVWYSYAIGDAELEWQEITDTPSLVRTRAGEIYYLEVSNSVDDADLSELARLRGLTTLHTLNLNGCEQLTDAGLSHLKGLTALQKLDFFKCEHLTDAGLAHLKSLTKIKSLTLGGCKRLTDAGLIHLGTLTALQTLDLSGCNQLTDSGLAHLIGLTALQSLDLGGCVNLTDVGLAHLKSLSALNTLSLSCCMHLTNAGLAHLIGLTALQTLDLNSTSITDAGLAVLKELSALRSLDLSCASITDAGLAHLKDLTGLQSLSLMRNWFDSEDRHLTNAGLANLKRMTSLKSLALVGYDQITDAGFAHLKSLTFLESLDLTHSSITDVGLAHIQDFTALQSLDLTYCEHLTDAGLVHLANLAALENLNLNSCGQLTEAGIETLQQALPNCHIDQ